MQVLDEANAVVPEGNLPRGGEAVVPEGNLPRGAEASTAGSAALDQLTVLQGNPLFSLREWLSPENVALFVVCMADMISTLYFVQSGMAVEDNPVFHDLLERGVGAFVAMKFASFMPLIAVSTYYRRRRPRLIVGAMRFTVAVYVVMYVVRFFAQYFGI